MLQQKVPDIATSYGLTIEVQQEFRNKGQFVPCLQFCGENGGHLWGCGGEEAKDIYTLSCGQESRTGIRHASHTTWLQGQALAFIGLQKEEATTRWKS